MTGRFSAMRSLWWTCCDRDSKELLGDDGSDDFCGRSMMRSGYCTYRTLVDASSGRVGAVMRDRLRSAADSLLDEGAIVGCEKDLGW